MEARDPLADMAAAPSAVQALTGLGTSSPARPAWAPWPHGPSAIYVDEARTHEVHAHVVPEGPSYRFVTRETPYGVRDPAQLFQASTGFQEAWEAKFHVADLEGRLAAIGRYWRQEGAHPGWTPVGRNPAVPRVDLRGLDLGAAAGVPGASFHPFHDPRAKRDRLLVTLPRRASAAFALADVEFRAPGLEDPCFHLVHGALPLPVLRSVLAREHIGMSQRGYDKLATPADFALAYGPTWRERLVQAFETVVHRIATWKPEEPPAPAPAREPDPPTLDYAAALTHPRLREVHRRFLKPGEEEALVAAGVPAIRRAVALKRRTAAHTEQHRLSALEASLLARHAIAARTTVDPEAARILRRLDLLL